MELRDIEYFLAVAQHGHLGRAAEALGLSQSALSKCLRRLEDSMHAKLVKRTPKGVELTAEGAMLLSHAHRLQLSFADVAREIADVAEGHAGHLRVGSGSGFAEHLLSAAFIAFLKDAPKVAVEVSVSTANDLVPALRNGALDLIVTGIPTSHYQDLFQDYLCDHTFVVYASANHRLARQKRVKLADLAEERWAIATTAHVLSWQLLHRAFEDRGLPPPRIAMATTSTAIRQDAVASSGLLGFGSRCIMQQAAPHLRLTEIRLDDATWRRRVGVSYRKDAYLSPAARRFIEILKLTAKNISAKS